MGGLGADAGDAGDVVGGIAHEAEEVDDLVGLGDAPDFRELFQANDFVFAAFSAGLPHIGGG